MLFLPSITVLMGTEHHALYLCQDGLPGALHGSMGPAWLAPMKHCGMVAGACLTGLSTQPWHSRRRVSSFACRMQQRCHAGGLVVTCVSALARRTSSTPVAQETHPALQRCCSDLPGSVPSRWHPTRRHDGGRTSCNQFEQSRQKMN